MGRPPRSSSRGHDDASREAAVGARTSNSANAGKVFIKPQDMFSDLVRRAPRIAEVARLLRKGPLRVATMCSGTESPILALRMIAHAVKEQCGLELPIEHKFSCEIEPFKQAYIERNFQPPLLFRDIRELGELEATTAYGAKERVPLDVDLLISGTSCVDNSSMNNQRKDGVDGDGESAQTFQGMMDWVERARPAIVIMENTRGAPWDKVVAAFQKSGYAAKHAFLDTKDYYIPHTRQRGYLVAVLASDANAEDVVDNWVVAVQSLRRESSASLEAFMLPDDDPRVQALRAETSCHDEDKSSTREWVRCEAKHRQARSEEGLGVKRPLTHWQDGGGCKLPDYAWNDWGRRQVERLLDVAEIQFLRAAKEGEDPQYKTQIWNLSQNVDRQGAAPPGISPCLCPNIVPFLTRRGGPLTGIETLALQGLPIDDLILTKMTNKQLKDLAGNAMTSTVVGCCTMVALVVALPYLAASIARKAPVKSLALSPFRAPSSPRSPCPSAAEPQVHIIGEKWLQAQPLDLRLQDHPVQELLEDARRSSRRCTCEGRSGLRPQIWRCRTCNHSVCSDCKGFPEHDYVPDQAASGAGGRLAPEVFGRKLTSLLPMRVRVSGFAREMLEALRPEQGVCPEVWCAWVQAVSSLQGAELGFRSLQRGEAWAACYASPEGVMLKLILDGQASEWQLALPPLPSCSAARGFLLGPVARMPLDVSARVTGLLDGHWQVRLPVTRRFTATVTGEGEKVEAWQAQLGLQGECASRRRFSRLVLHVPSTAPDDISCAVAGTYALLDKCGGAAGTLHKRESAGRPTWLFLDPDSVGESRNDSLVVAHTMHRLAFGEVRGELLRFHPGWRPADPSFVQRGSQEVQCWVDGQWQKLGGALEESRVCCPQSGLQLLAPTAPVEVVLAACRERLVSAVAVLGCAVPLVGKAETCTWASGAEWETLHLRRSSEKLAAISWVTERLALKLPEALQSWSKVHKGPDPSLIRELRDMVAPTPPRLDWICRKGSKEIEPIEDPRQAGAYERAVRNRPEAFVLQLRQQNGAAELRLAVNVGALSLSAEECLRRGALQAATGTSRLSWRLVQHTVQQEDRKPAPFIMGSNRADPEHCNPKLFRKFPLRPEQRRSLSWMMSQEASSVPFVEEEVEEAVLKEFGWRAEGRATRDVHVRGGVLADEVGYGKTAISLGLIAAAPPRPAEELALGQLNHQRIPTKATLVLAPSHLMKQWPGEVAKFLGTSLSVETVHGLADLNHLTIQRLRDADVVIVATSLFRSNLYFERLRQLSGCARELPAKGGRHFSEAYGAVLGDLGNRAAELMKGALGDVARAVELAVESLAQQRQSAVAADVRRGKKATYAMEKRSGVRNAAGRAAQTRRRPGLQEEEDSEQEIEEEEIGDHWGFEGASARKDAMQLRSPPLELFAWRRVIVDEFTYLTPSTREHTAVVRGLHGQFRWVLSGTPPLRDFENVCSIAAFLGVNLGAKEAPSPGRRGGQSKMQELTNSETFRSLMEEHTPAWHSRRRRLAQDFLDRYVRQNKAEVDEIPQTLHEERVQITPAERAVYLELENYLQQIDGAGLRGAAGGPKSQAFAAGDRGKRLRNALGEAASPEEALMRNLISTQPGGGMGEDACKQLEDLRHRELQECQAEVATTLQEALSKEAGIQQVESDFACEFLQRWRCHARGGGDGGALPSSRSPDGVEDAVGQDCGDPEAAVILRQLEIKAQDTGSRRCKRSTSQPVTSQPRKLTKTSSGAKVSTEVDLKSRKWELREFVVRTLWPLSKELVSRVRSLRYLREVRAQQTGNLQRKSCPGCGKATAEAEQGLLACCGHAGCLSCLQKCAKNQECIVRGCAVCTHPRHVVAASAFRCPPSAGSVGGSTARLRNQSGSKLAAVVELIKACVRQGEKVLVFLQFPDLLDAVAKTLHAVGVQSTQLMGTALKKSAALDDFQKSASRSQVLLLNVKDESASGANLTVANHAVFLHPLLTSTREDFEAIETQAIGRIRRYGQGRECHIWHLLVPDSIDSRVFEKNRRAAAAPAAVAPATVAPAVPGVLPAVMPLSKMELEQWKQEAKDEREHRGSPAIATSAQNARAQVASAPSTPVQQRDSRDSSVETTPPRRLSRKASMMELTPPPRQYKRLRPMLVSDMAKK
mmetsp:Transcript_13824/g.25733  ORF Transcript_13824/g.25733 Transcript_13824/m.25733 type:complete len:2142 (+) Transcript_13824:104-6529(+)